MKRQASACSRNHHSIGCMSGLFRLLSTYPRRRKSITFGKKQDRAPENVNVKPLDSEPVTPASKVEHTPPSSQLRNDGGTGDQKQSKQAKGLSPGREVPRSPTIPAEIRSPPTGLVAKLMGLQLQDEMSLTPESAAEKRRLLMGALEKCDEDLKTLKRIIQVVKMSVGDGADNKDGSFSPPASAVNAQSTKPCITEGHAGRSWPRQQQRKPGEEGIAAVASRFTERIIESVYDAAKSVSPDRPSRVNKAMAESVEQVCKDIEWGEKREAGRIGLVLQDYICRDLIEEIVKDMGRRRNTALKSLPLQACKRRLSF